jgi:hypothetical protein
MQAQQDWRQTLAATSVAESRASEEKTKAQAAKATFASDQEFQSALKKIAPSLPMMEKLSAIAGAAANSGKYREAEQTLAAMSQLENRESLKEQRAAAAQENKTKIAGQKTERQLTLLSGVKDEETKRIAEELYKQEYGEESPLAKYPYSPKLVQMASEALTKKRSGTQEALDKARAVAEYARAARDNKVGEAQSKYYGARVDAIKEKSAAGTKAGGKLAEVKPEELKTVEAKLRVDHPGLSKEEADLASKEVAADAKDIQLREHGSFSDAMSKALDARKGQFTKFPAKTFLGIETSKGGAKYQSLPAGVPKGSKHVGATPKGKKVWQAPDGKRYVEDTADEEND